MGKGSFLYSAAVLWNGLPASMKTIFSLVSFKNSLEEMVEQQTVIGTVIGIFIMVSLL